MPTVTSAPPSPIVETHLDPVSPPAAHPQSSNRLILLLAFLLAGGTFALYAPAMSNGFVNYDDSDYVTQNSHVLQALTWPNIVWAFGTDNPAANWHPLTWISHMLDVQWYGLGPAGHHFTNVLLHSVGVALLFLAIALGTSRIWPSAAVAAMYALHPLNVEAVAWVAERKAVLSMFFLFLTLLAYGWYVHKPNAARYGCVLLSFALGLMSKVMLIALPFALLLLDYWPLRRFPDSEDANHRRSFAQLVLEKIPLLVLSVGAGAMTLFVHHKEGALTASVPLAWRVKNALYSYIAYLGKQIWPSHLAVFYPHPENSLSWSVVALCTMLLLAITALIWRYRQRRYLLVGWLWYLGTMFPMIGFIQSGRQGMADRYMQLPMLGLLVALIWFIADSAARARLDRRNLLTASFALLAVPYVLVSHVQIAYWHDSISLFTHALQVTHNNGVAENDLGSALLEKGQIQLAEPHFRAATRIIPDLASAHYNLAVTQHRQNHLDEAVREYRQSITLFSDPLEAAQAHNNLGILYLSLQNNSEAMKELSAAISLNPAEQNSYIGRGTIELQSFNIDAAIADFTHAAQISPSPIACFWLGRALETKGDYPRAATAYHAALQLAPQMNDAKVRLDALRDKIHP
jgi:tetratricopeptide (TPR) repeat protein